MTAAGCRPGSLGQRVDLEAEECLCMGTRTARHCPGRRETYGSSGSSSMRTGGDTRRRIPTGGMFTRRSHTHESTRPDPAPLQGLAAKGPGTQRWSELPSHARSWAEREGFSPLGKQLYGIHHWTRWSPIQLTRGHLIKICELY